ncbi:MAG: hypothetical protein ABL967_19730 [Bryobacteraceae bacterium]
MRIATALFVAFLVPFNAQAQANVQTLKAEFKLEDSGPAETLIWVSGWSYALTEIGQSAGPRTICLAKGEFVESKVLLDALNAKFKGQRITSEQAAPVLFAQTKAKYPCGKK